MLLVLLPCIMLKQQQESVALGNLIPRRAPLSTAWASPRPRSLSSLLIFSKMCLRLQRQLRCHLTAGWGDGPDQRCWIRSIFDCHPAPCFGSEDYWIVTLTSNKKEKQTWDMLSFVQEKDARLVHHKHTTIPRQALFLSVHRHASWVLVDMSSMALNIMSLKLCVGSGHVHVRVLYCTPF